MKIKRRVFLKGTLAASAVGVAVGAGLLTPQEVLAAWPKSAFEAKNIDNALKDLVGSSEAAESGDITIKAPDIAENGAVVPITVSSTLPKVNSVTLLVEQNNIPLAATYELTEGTEAYVSNRLKMGKTSDVIAVVKSDGKLYSAKKPVKVTIGGCGG